MGLFSKLFPVSIPLPRPPVPEGKTRICVCLVVSIFERKNPVFLFHAFNSFHHNNNVTHFVSSE